MQDAASVVDVVWQLHARAERRDALELAVSQRSRAVFGVGAEVMRFMHDRDVWRSTTSRGWRSLTYGFGSLARCGSLGSAACRSVVGTSRGGFTNMSHCDFTWWSITEAAF